MHIKVHSRLFITIFTLPYQLMSDHKSKYATKIQLNKTCLHATCTGDKEFNFNIFSFHFALFAV